MRVYYYEYEASITASLHLNQQQAQDLIASPAQVASGEPGSAMLIGAWYTWLCYANRSLALLCSSILVYLAPNVDRRWPSWRAWLCYANRSLVYLALLC